MKVCDLIEALRAMPPDREVILSKDAEGNGYSPLAHLAAVHYRAQTTWHGDLADEAEPNAVALWPVC